MGHPRTQPSTQSQPCLRPPYRPPRPAPQDKLGLRVHEQQNLLLVFVEAAAEEVEQRFGGAGAGKDFGRRLGSAEWLQAVQDNQDAREFRDYVLRFTEDLDLLYGITCDHLDEMGAKYD